MSAESSFEIRPGLPLPLGANVVRNGVQFSIFSRHATSVSLVIFTDGTPLSEYSEILLDPKLNKTGDIWHIWVGGIGIGTHYGYKIGGSYQLEKGHRFNKNKLLLDPYARLVTDNTSWNLIGTYDNIYNAPRGIVTEMLEHFDKPQIHHLPEESIIYEVHVRGFTKHDSSIVEHPGTYKGLIEKIPYLKELGITAIELLPVQEFNMFEKINVNPETGERLKNFWGYNTLAFFAPMSAYASENGRQIHEFIEMVHAMHRADIAVILDIVFNHTAEGDHLGPTLSFRGIDNSVYYILDDDKSLYKNFSGCGNTVNCNNPIVSQFILDCLRYWTIEMGVDGFRFDLASILGRDQKGNIISNPPIIQMIEQDPILRYTKIIAEAWDAAGAYQLGDFPDRWSEWNGRFRDDVRRFWRGDINAANFATRLCGSEDIYKNTKNGPCRSINFITCHDGFSLYDLVSYNEKHNIANGEDNKDGENYNISCNHGVEGPTDSEEIKALRIRQAKNFMATLLLSQGIPMLTAGDEFLKTKNGNNNAYCQDNDISWIDWNLGKENTEMFRFTKEMIQFRKSHPILRRTKFFTGLNKNGNGSDVSWFNALGKTPDWTENQITMVLNGVYAVNKSNEHDNDICIMFNQSWDDINCTLPAPPSGKGWNLVIDTSLSSPLDICEKGKEIAYYDKSYMLKKLSTVVFISN